MISPDKLAAMLGPDGEIARAHPNYEHRPGQIQMAQAVVRAIENRHHLCVEAGTGTGKTLAYLLPAIYSAKRVIISTGTKNLQEQVFFKDVPFLEKALDRKLSVCYVKGRSNYLCLKKLSELDSGGHLFAPADPQHLAVIRKWKDVTQTGDLAELKELPEDLVLWRQLDARRETCTGQRCPDFDACFVTRVRQRALESDIVIVNHHLFFADLALRQGDFGSVLPDYSVVIFDEAHELEDVATQYFGVMVSNYRLEELVRDTDKALADTGSEAPALRRQLARLRMILEDFFSPFQDREGRFPMEELGDGLGLRRGPESGKGVEEPYRKLVSQLALLESGLRTLDVSSDVIEALIRRASELQEELQFIMESESMEYVYWFDVRGRGVFLWASPINVSTILAERLFRQVDTVVLTSATLSTGGNFQFIRSRLGLEQARELILDSHFDFRSQAILYIPRNIPEPRESGWAKEACTQLETILRASRGRAFVLFTSYAQMELMHSSLLNRLPFPMFVQGEMSRSGLLERFRETPNAVLFATSSFWQGVDVQGEQLSCVVIDKLPFSVPSEPVVAARIRFLNDSGANAFYDYQIPEAIILLKQGLGRLIRSRSDRGILALLDKRILTKRYGPTFLRSLPPAPVTHDLGDLCNFFPRSES
jgi:ATP-dependent DNA helicase DinG